MAEHTGRARMAPPDLSEKGGLKDGAPQRSDVRLFMQLLCFGGCGDVVGVAQALSVIGIETVVYEDLNDPTGIGILTVSEDPNAFIDIAAPAIRRVTDGLSPKPEFSMFGRTYALGYEPDLQDTLTGRPRRTVLRTGPA